MKTSAKGVFQLLKGLKWPVKITIIAIVLSLLSTVIGLIVPLVTKDLVDTLTTTAFNWKMIGILLVVFLLQSISGEFHFIYYLISENLSLQIFVKNYGTKYSTYPFPTMIKMKAAKR